MHALRKVFGNWRYVLIAAVVSTTIFVVAVWLPNLHLLAVIWGEVPIADKFLWPLRLLKAITTNFTVLSAFYTVAIALLIGVNVALIIYMFRQRLRKGSSGGATTGAVGIISGALGIGCAACSSLVITSILASVGGAGLLAFLPLRGGEFGLIGVALLLIATYLLTKQISKPMVCDIPVTTS